MIETRDDRQMTQYLLGELPPAEQEAVLDRIVTDEAYFEALCAWEDQLVRRYLRGELSGDQHDRFDVAYSFTPARQRRVAAERGLLEVEGSQANAVPAPLWELARESLWTWPGPSLAVGSAASAILAVLLTLAFTRSASVDAPRVVESVNLSAAQNQRRAAARDASERGGGARSPGATSPAVAPIPVFLTADVTDLRLVVELESAIEAAGPLEVTLNRDSGTVATTGRWRVSGTTLSLTVPARELVDGGDYTLTVGRRGVQGVDLAAHAFHVSRETTATTPDS